MKFLSAQERAELLDHLRAIEEGEKEWQPLPGPQTLAYYSLADILFYGGAAGGGKTDLLLGLAHKEHTESIIFRRQATQLAGIEKRAIQLLDKFGRYNSVKQIWRLTAPRYVGKIIEFGSCNNLGDEEKYQGRPHDLKGIDEITHFLEYMFRFLTAWTRTTIPGQRTRIVCTGNPPTSSEGDWVIPYFAPWLDQNHPNPAKPGELRWYTTLKTPDGMFRDIERPNGEPFEYEGEIIVPKSRTFIPARVEDNPYLMESGYKSTLQGLPEPLRSKMLYGSFTAGREDDEWQLIPTEWVMMAQARWRERTKPLIPMTAMGMDVARGGQDYNVFSPRYGNWYAPQVKHPGTSTPDGQRVAGLAIIELRDSATAIVDVIGVGSSAYDHLKDLWRWTVPFNSSERDPQATDKLQKFTFPNKRSEWYWKFREALDPTSGVDLALPDDSELRADLCAPRWCVQSGKIVVESKEETKKRIGRSPDKGDSAVYAWVIPPVIKPTSWTYQNLMSR